MNIKPRSLISLYLAMILGPLSMHLYANTDDADSLDFESCHAEDKHHQISKKKPLFSRKNNDNKTLTTSSTYNTQDALAFLQSQTALYQAMDTQCPKGWVKTLETSTLIQQNRQLSFNFHCL